MAGQRRGWAMLVVLVTVGVLAFGAVLLWAAERERDEPAPRLPLALFTGLPIYWTEAPDIAGMLDRGTEVHWARTTLETKYTLRLLDTLEGLGKGQDRNLLMAQPRPLSPAENVALDGWVRSGGRVLLFADPMLTQDSDFALGDPRRPQDMVLLSPILNRWGLALEFQEDQPLGERSAAVDSSGMDIDLPVNLPGRLASVSDGSCAIDAAGMTARCVIGQGRVTVIADAALFERVQGEAAEPRRRALLALARAAFE